MSKTIMPGLGDIFDFAEDDGSEDIGPVYRVTETNARFDGETAKVTIGLETEESLKRFTEPEPEPSATYKIMQLAIASGQPISEICRLDQHQADILATVLRDNDRRRRKYSKRAAA